MSTKKTPARGRHRAPVEPRAALPPTALPVLLTGLAVVIIAVVIIWQAG